MRKIVNIISEAVEATLAGRLTKPQAQDISDLCTEVERLRALLHLDGEQGTCPRCQVPVSQMVPIGCPSCMGDVVPESEEIEALRQTLMLAQQELDDYKTGMRTTGEA